MTLFIIGFICGFLASFVIVLVAVIYRMITDEEKRKKLDRMRSK